ncbi:MAG: hypothetical protein ACRDPC_20595 [Solirubrobacteraceae bacterium]
MDRRDRPQAWEPPVVLSAGFPDEDDDVPSAQLLEIEEALLSLTRASLAQGRRLVLPADPVVVPLVAHTAAEYAEDIRTEAADVPPPLVHVLLTEGRDDQLAEALSGLDHVRLAPFSDPREERRGRQRLTAEALDELGPSAGVVFGGASESLDDLELIRAHGIPLYVIGTALAGRLRERGDLWEYDIVEGALADVDWGAAETDAERSVPYPYVMQVLVERWGPTDARG